MHESGFSFTDIIVILIAILLFIWLQKSKRTTPKKEKAADWFQVKSIDEDGLITTEDDRYLLMVEIQPVSFALKSPTEQKMIWSAFRDCINMISHPIRMKAEAHPYDLDDYFLDLKGKAVETGDESIMSYVDEMKETFTNFLEQNKIQDRRYYLFLETDNRFLAELNAEISNPLLNDLLKSNAAKNMQSDIDTVKQELNNSLRVVKTVFHGVGLWTHPLRREDVLQYLYRTGNRDIASALSLDELMERAAMGGEKIQSFGKIVYGGEESNV
jgi:hypothetical protein